MNTQQLIDAAKRKNGIQSDQALARVLDLNGSTIVRYRQSHTIPQPYIAERLGELAGLAPGQGILICEKERSRTPAERRFWDIWHARVIEHHAT